MQYQYKARDIQRALVFYIERPDIMWLPNVHFAGGECDLLTVSKSGYATEFEIKISIEDWRRDKNKVKWTDEKREKISQFYYCIPRELLEKEPDFVNPDFGILTFKFKEGGWFSIREERKAKKLTDSIKLTDKEQMQLLKKGWFRYRSGLIHKLRTENEEFINANSICDSGPSRCREEFSSSTTSDGLSDFEL